MESRALLACLQAALPERKGGIASLILQNHLYGCFIVIEDLAQGILTLEEGHLTGNGMYLNLETQFGQIGVRYYGFTMDGKAVLEDCPPGYKEAWFALFRDAATRKDISEVDRLEEEVLAVLDAGVDGVDRFFMNALDHEGNLSPDWVERALYMLHPGLVKSVGAAVSAAAVSAAAISAAVGTVGTVGAKEEAVGEEAVKSVRSRKGGRGPLKGSTGRGLSLTRRNKVRGGTQATARSYAYTRRRTVREREPILLDVRE